MTLPRPVRLVLIALLCVVAASGAAAVGAAIFFGPLGDGSSGVGWFVWLFGAVVGTPAMLLLGLPLHAALSRVAPQGWAYALAGALAGAGSAFAFVELALKSGDGFASGTAWESLPVSAAFGAPAGLLAALLFFHLQRRDRQRHAPA